VVYHLHNWYETNESKFKAFLGEKRDQNNIKYFLKFQLDGREHLILWCDFIGHPQLKRILNMDEMISHPCEKSFRWKMEDVPIKTTVSLEEQ
jgi:NADH-quinone oxidoreductase subunit C